MGVGTPGACEDAVMDWYLPNWSNTDRVLARIDSSNALNKVDKRLNPLNYRSA